MRKAPSASSAHDIHRAVQAQFGPAATAYGTSAGHGDPEQLAELVRLAEPRPTDLALDIATGAGHVALAFAPHVAHVVAYDLTPQMLEETERRAAARGLGNVRVREGAAEALPFDDATFDIVAVRLAPHHFADIQCAVHEMARVAKPGARVVVADTTVPEDDELDREINHIETLRDPSHVRDYRPSEWTTILERAGLHVVHCAVDSYTEGGRMRFSDWTSRMRTPPPVVAELETLFRTASPLLAHALDIRVDGASITFCLPKVTLAATKPVGAADRTADKNRSEPRRAAD